MPQWLKDTRASSFDDGNRKIGIKMKTFLHVGCGPDTKDSLKGFQSDDWKEIRFDINKNWNPDIIGTLTDMSKVETQSVDAIYSSHNIEHLFPHEVPTALREFHRVLKPTGFVVITCPDLISVCEAVVRDRLLEPLFQSENGPITPLDILYGHRGFIAQGNVFMAHKCGFTYSVLNSCFYEAGFIKTFGGARSAAFDLWMVAFKSEVTDEEATVQASIFLP
jgi:predicted SAM-dependent methyltransferase